MDLTKNFIRTKQPCAEGFRWFLRVGRRIDAGGRVVAGESLVSGDDIRCGGNIRSNGSLESGGRDKAGRGIEARGAKRVGESLSAFKTIRAGTGYGVFAGLNVQMAEWGSGARVCASEKPGSLMTGWWAGARDV